MDRLYNTPVNLRLRYIAIGIIGAVIALQLAMVIWLDDISPKAMLFMRGCVGLGAIIFVILITILAYRVVSTYLRGPGKPMK